MFGLLSDKIKITTMLDYASGTASRNGAALDMEGFEGVLILVKHAAIAGSAAGDIHAEQGAESDLSDAADLLGTKIAVADDDDDQLFVLDIFRPRERYIRGVVTKNGANAQAESALYIQYGARKQPVTNAVADTVEIEQHLSPAEGTK